MNVLQVIEQREILGKQLNEKYGVALVKHFYEEASNYYTQQEHITITFVKSSCVSLKVSNIFTFPLSSRPRFFCNTAVASAKCPLDASKPPNSIPFDYYIQKII